MAGVFDDALEKRYQLSPEIVLADVDGTDVFLIHNAQTGTVLRISASTLASFINAAVSQADILEALDAPYGVATLGSDSKVPAAQLPSYVDDVLEFANYAALPATGESGKIYVLATPYTSGGVTSSQFRWSGSAYSPIIASPGSTDAVTEGSVNLYHTTARAAAAAPVQSVAGRAGAVTLSKGDVGLSNVDNTSDLNKPVSTAQQTALDAKAPKADPVFTGGSITLPVGTTGERPSGGSGKLRMNSTTSRPEWFDPVGQTWVSFNATEYEVEYFVLGGGGGGGGAQGGIGTYNTGGGGGGGYSTGTLKVFSGSSYSATVGNGGNGGTGIGAGGVGSSGQSSSFAAFSAGGGQGATLTNGGASGSPQSNAGGVETASATWGSGGGGGAGAAGANGTATNGGNGGVGVEWPASSGTYYGGGGGGGIYLTSGQTAGVGGNGGGASAPLGNGNGNNGTTNKGGGGSGAGAMGGAGSSNYTGGAGGSGVVIIRYAGSQRGTGGTVTSAGGYTYHTLSSSGTFTA